MMITTVWSQAGEKYPKQETFAGWPVPSVPTTHARHRIHAESILLEQLLSHL